ASRRRPLGRAVLRTASRQRERRCPRHGRSVRVHLRVSATVSDGDVAARNDGHTTELLRALIRNRCVNDEGSGGGVGEARNASTLASVLDGAGIDQQTYEAAPG